MRTRPALIAIACSLLAFGSCVPPEESNDKVKSYDPETTIMGVIQQRGFMRIGIPSDHPPFALVDDETQGFVVDLGLLAADALGVRAELVPARSEELLDMVYVSDDDLSATVETDVDVAFPMVPITERLAQVHTFTDPYWVGHTRTLFRGGEEVTTDRDVTLLARAYAMDGAKVGGEQLSTEGYGAAVRRGATTFANIVSQVFNEADAEGDWGASYERWLAALFVDPDPAGIPIMTVEDAAALHPEGLD